MIEPYAWESGVLWAAELDADGVVERANETLRRARRERVVGRPFVEFVAAVQRPAVARRLAAPPAAWERLTVAFDEPGAALATDRRLWLRARAGGALVVVEQPVRDAERLSRELLRLTHDLVAEQRDLAGERDELSALYEREHRTAELLQRALLPERLPDVPGLRLAARFRAGGEGVRVGGDWYDAIERDDGSVTLALGDVAGKGVAAASLMGMFRSALRAFALEGGEPRDVLARLDVVARRSDELATVLVADVEPASGAISFASAGHPPPLLVRPGDGARLLEGGRSGPLLAFDGSLEPGRETLHRGDVLVLYSDGLFERRDVVIDDRLDALVGAGAAAGGGAEEVTDTLIAAMLGDRGAADDVTLLAVERV